MTAGLHLDAVTIGSRFGEIPRGLPMPVLPALSWDKAQAVFGDAVTIAILAGIESLLSAVIADGMTGSRHRSNVELVAQGVANVLSPLFGGLPATGAIARTATNIRSGSTGPVSGLLHAVFLLIFMLVAAPLMSYVPLAVLAAILGIVAWNMSEVHVVLATLRNGGWGDRAVLLSTFGLTVFYDLTLGIEVGVGLSALLFMHAMAEATGVEEAGDDAAALPDGLAEAGIAVYRINGPFFFGAASEVATTLGRIGRPPRRLILDLSAVPIVDSTGLSVLRTLIGDIARRKGDVILVGPSMAVLRALIQAGLTHPHVPVTTMPTLPAALRLPPPGATPPA